MKVRTASVTACAMARYWANLATFIGPMRSTATPAKAVTTTVGNRSAKATMPSQALEPVSSHATQPMPMRCIQVPMSEAILPVT